MMILLVFEKQQQQGSQFEHPGSCLEERDEK